MALSYFKIRFQLVLQQIGLYLNIPNLASESSVYIYIYIYIYTYTCYNVILVAERGVLPFYRVAVGTFNKPEREDDNNTFLTREFCCSKWIEC